MLETSGSRIDRRIGFQQDEKVGFGETIGSDYRLSEVSEETGLYPQQIINLISRYGILQPNRRKGTYWFTSDDLKTIRKVQELRRRDHNFHAIAEEIRNDKLY